MCEVGIDGNVRDVGDSRSSIFPVLPSGSGEIKPLALALALALVLALTLA